MIGKIFWTGIKTLVPIALVVALVAWLVKGIEAFFGTIIILIIGPNNYFPGLGFLVGIILVFIIGLAMNAWLGKKVHQLGELILSKIPLIKTLYSSLTDLMGFFDKDSEQRPKGHVVTVALGNMRVLGVVTREVFEGLPNELHPNDEVAVLIPMAYNLGGLTLFVPKQALTPVDMTVERALRFALTAGLVSKK